MKNTSTSGALNSLNELTEMLVPPGDVTATAGTELPAHAPCELILPGSKPTRTYSKAEFRFTCLNCSEWSRLIPWYEVFLSHHQGRDWSGALLSAGLTADSPKDLSEDSKCLLSGMSSPQAPWQIAL